jgi:hypothetical protein
MVTRWLTVLIDLYHWVTPDRRCDVLVLEDLPSVPVNNPAVRRGELGRCINVNAEGIGYCDIAIGKRPRWNGEVAGCDSAAPDVFTRLLICQVVFIIGTLAARRARINQVLAVSVFTDDDE